MLEENTRRINLENNISSAHRNASISSEVYEPGRGNCSQSHGRADRSACMPGTDKQVLCKSLSDPFLLINTLKEICLTKMTVAWENEQGVLYRRIWKSFMNFLFCFVFTLFCTGRQLLSLTNSHRESLLLLQLVPLWSSCFPLFLL